MRRTQTRECGYQYDPPTIRDRTCHRIHLLSGLDQMQSISQPLHDRSTHEDAPLKSELLIATDFAGCCCDQSLTRDERLIANILQ